MIRFSSSGNFNNIEKFFKKATTYDITPILHKYGKMGVDVLTQATPINSGETAASWVYKIENSNNKSSISWSNTNIVDGIPIVILLQFGHGTGTGGYVQGVDFIKPAIKDILDKMADDIWKEVTK